MVQSITSRTTSKELRIEYLPNFAAAAHVEHWYFNTNVSGGTFKVEVNGNLSAAITFSATAATLISNINAALDALPNLSAADIVASGSVITDITLTGAASAYYRIVLPAAELALTGNTTDEDDVVQEVTTQGSVMIDFTSEMIAYNDSLSIDTADMTAISEQAATEVFVKSMLDFDFSVFDADQSWLHIVQVEGACGTITVYPDGKIVGKRVYSFKALIKSVDRDEPDHDKVEVSISGCRVGEWLIQPYRVYTG